MSVEYPHWILPVLDDLKASAEKEDLKCLASALEEAKIALCDDIEAALDAFMSEEQRRHATKVA